MALFLRSLVLLFLLSLTSCFEVIEEVNLKNDGTGDFMLTVNMSEHKTKLASIMLLDSVRGYRVPSKTEILSFLNDLNNYLKDSEGISQVKHTYDFEEFIFTLSFNFNKVENINSAIERLNFKNGKKPENLNFVYSYNKSTKEFSRKYSLPPNTSNSLNQLSEEDKANLVDAIYTSIIRFEKEIVSASNKRSRISPNGKAVMLRSNAVDIIKGQINLSNTIQL